MGKGKCRRCGACCTGLINDICEADLRREPRLRSHAMLLRHFDQAEEPRYFLATPCPFLRRRVTGETYCIIYSTRPGVCVGYKPGSTPLCPLYEEDT